MKRVYLIRHGLPDFPNGIRMCLGRTDLPLSPAGLVQAEHAAQALQNVPITAVFSSPLQRAIQTARPLGQPIQILEGLRELDAGIWDGLTFEEIKKQDPELFAKRRHNPALPLPGGETSEAGLNRFQEAMTIADARSSGDFAVVTHGAVMALFLKSLGLSWYKPDYAEIITLHVQNGHFFQQEGDYEP